MPARTPAAPNGQPARRPRAPWLAAVALLAGCASTRNADFAGARPQTSQPPSHIVILVTDQPPPAPQPGQAQPGQKGLTPQENTALATALKAQLDQRMRWPKDGVTIAAAPPPPRADTLLLQCTVTQVEPGSQAWRLAVGFGAGRARLGIATRLVDLRGPAPIALASFRTSSSTGSMPGPALGLVGAAASASAVGLVGGSAGLFMGSRQTLDRELTQSSARIVTQLQAYFTQNGWPSVPLPAPSVLASASARPSPSE